MARSKESPANVGDVGLIPGLGRSPGEKKWQLTLEFLPGKPHGERTLAHYSPGVISFWCIAETIYMVSGVYIYIYIFFFRFFTTRY